MASTWSHTPARRLNEKTVRAKPAISVVVPHFNQPHPLRRCLLSLQAQEFEMEQVEIIVVDNGSKRLPTDICSAFPGVRLASEPSPGPGPARNKGVSVSCGDTLAFIDADCIADRGWLAAIAAAFTENSAVQVVGGDVRIAIADPTCLTMLEAYESIYAYRQQDYIERQGFSGTGNLAMQRAVYDAVGSFAGITLAEDREWGQRATRMGYQIRYLPNMIVYHPARRSMSELYAKWDRHVGHDFEEYGRGVGGRLRWLGRALAVAGSPVFELRRIMSSRRIVTPRERLLAMKALIGIRLYRARRMLGMLVKASRVATSVSWNRN